MDLAGQILDGRYQLGSLLGVGGMAKVYLATDRVLERQVAVKVLSQPYAQDPSFVERFRREARSAARLSHPNIVAVFDSGSDAEQLYLVMEHVAGQSLAQLLADQGRLAPRRAAELGVEVCAALAAAHAQGLVHRDVKPANVLIGEDGRVQVADFGIVKAAATATLTGTGTVLGTAAYLSPEQAQGAGGCPRGPVQLGMRAGRAALWHPSVRVGSRRLSGGGRQPTRGRAVRAAVGAQPQVDAGLDAVVLTALAKDPAQRYQSAVELQDALEQVLAGEAVAAGPGQPARAAVPTEPLPGLPGRTGVLPAAPGLAIQGPGRRLGWPRWALPVAGLALGIGLVAVLWPDGGSTPTRGEAGPTAAPATGASSTTTPGSAATPAPSAPGVDAALANLTAVITAARQQGTADEQAEDLLGPGRRPRQGPPGEPQGPGPGQGRRQGQGRGRRERRGQGRG